ncbi:MAG TPA: hypothetical protein EYP98_05500 [Planctomycetes bacterium]|nr:hypothetical protein [Planctomycetota bacterium]
MQSESIAVVKQGPWMGRDGFVAETAVQFDRVQGSIARLERELEKSKKVIAEMAEEANRTRRFQTFEETLKNERDYKLTDLQRAVREVKSRMEVIEGDRSVFAGLTYKSFEAIDKKLSELAKLQAQIEASERNGRRNLIMMGSATLVALIAIATNFI